MEWEQHGSPYLAFLPTEETFSGPLWRRLAIDKDHFPVKGIYLNGRYRYRMDEQLVDSWIRLEDNLLRMIDILKAASNFRAINFPPLPESTLLKTTHERMDTLIKAALTTRDRFVFLGAVLAFYISLQRTSNWAPCMMPVPEYAIPDNGERQQEWRAELLTAGVHAQWLAFVESSSIVTKQVKRRGVIINYRKSEFSVLLIAYGVPVILRIQAQYINHDVDVRFQQQLLKMFGLLGHTNISAEEMNNNFRKYIPPPVIVSRLREQVATGQAISAFSFELKCNGKQTSWLSVTPRP